MKKIVLLVFISLLVVSCKTTGGGVEPVSGPVFKEPGECNLKISAYNSGIVNPNNDRRSYYRVYIDKIDSGRTETGLESQKKSLNINVSNNRHLIQVEKYVLDEEQKKYVKLNNIHQPKPSYQYIDVVKGRITVVEIKQNDKENKAEIIVSYEED